MINSWSSDWPGAVYQKFPNLLFSQYIHVDHHSSLEMAKNVGKTLG